MKKLALVLTVSMLPLAAIAEDYVYDPGTYWTVTAVDTHPGHFDDYLENINGAWKKSMEMLIADGKVLSYRMMYNVNGANDEPDLYLMVEWKSGAEMLDTPRSYYDAQNEKLFGSLDKGQEQNIKRGEIRTIMGETLLREITFK
ncbi:hypothetical protein FV139_00020 [Parahaliea maris]|uniref:ABM domain-containing protein n=1 Tax=Parahaliea maris TaxID=2716870 RepID=A0A5C9A8P3_9GAMM|nr:hypothetical protein [Parahaliea maris]TXS95937.1 hypothetical protein FV139_00020 [Parahaliea maris]